ncbi:type 4a pilus biogenesis protein PilO [Vibrio sp. SCSIO 43136]|uniref:type 4a pilus biogenesis protein PilO n=1 Tax=Vibrio sp. SCSIO 43136 TaxID=2819101 RepID=UPI0020759A0A|nr:type 4a pilus biogenesis protein PilO [Vibrio sp. SCSIO 43136]USD65025.1 type 4a pilus biogenesis protein PilO [Vibrio sp. SCSIO 43136]
MAKLDDLNEKFIALSPREKWIIALGGLIAIVMLALTFFIEPALEQSQQKTNQINSLQQSITRSNNDILRITNLLRTDPDKEINIKLEQLQKQSEQLDKQFEEVVKNLITPSQMAELLEQVLISSKGLKLHSLESQPAEPITTDKGDGYAGYYIHPVKIHLSGKYFAIQKYLATLENMPVRYFWRSFHYQVDEYPTAELTLVVYTLGTGQEFIGG